MDWTGLDRVALNGLGHLNGFPSLSRAPSERMKMNQIEASRMGLVPDRLQNDARSGALFSCNVQGAAGWKDLALSPGEARGTTTSPYQNLPVTSFYRPETVMVAIGHGAVS